MSGLAFEKTVALSKFRGTLIGGLLGDCFGAPFEGDETVARVILQRFFNHMETTTAPEPKKKYTDDTCMTKAIASSLIENAALNETDIAKRFVKSYFSEPGRGYGEGVITVFTKLHQSKFADIWEPARQQFQGMGSIGNGGAMRVAPVALFCCMNYDLMLDTAEKITKLTHTNKLGIRGALLQAMAVHQSFLTPSDQEIDVNSFLSDLIKKMDEIESADLKDECMNPKQPPGTYKDQLMEVEELLKKGDDVCPDEVVDTLGNSLQALYSVPTAIYCFLRAQRCIKDVETDDKFRRVIQYSILLGGDTDTIASMAGSISGAHHGFDCINKKFLVQCEGVDDILKLADELYAVTPIN